MVRNIRFRLEIGKSQCLLLRICLALASLAAGSLPAATVFNAADLNPGTSGSNPANLKTFGGALFFSALTGATGEELWKYQGTSITLVFNINDNVTESIGHNSSPSGMTEYAGALYFSAYDERRGGELWRTDGTNCARVADINPDANEAIKTSPASSWPKELTVLGNTLFLAATSGTKDNYELWKFDGIAASLAANVKADSGSDFSSYPRGLTVFDSGLYFMADDGHNGFELWKLKGTNTTSFDINPGDSRTSSYPQFFTPLNGRLYFQAFHSLYGYELWQTDGTNASLVADLNPAAASSFPEHLTAFQGALYFSANDGIHGSELCKRDGVSVTLVSNINFTLDSYPKNLTVFGDLLCFAADDGIHGWELWSFNGTTASLVTDLNPSGDSFPESLTVFNNALYFSATNPATGYELWRFDGTNVTLAADIHPGLGSSFPVNLTVCGNVLCFSAANDGLTNWELWVLSAPASPIALVNPVAMGPDFVFSFSSQAGQTYEVQFTGGLEANNWQPLATLTGTGGALNVTDSLLAAARRYYRVQRK